MGEDTSFEHFSWGVLTGQSGAGKTRMALHLGRLLGRADALEADGGVVLPWLRRRVVLVGAWWRAVWPWAVRRVGDPWDAGRLGRSGGAVWAGRWAEWQRLIKELKTWRPRRSTFVLLDDPTAEVAKEVLAALNESAQHFRFPVRLLMASQSVPTSVVRFQGGTWHSTVDGFSGEVVQLRAGQALGDEDFDRLLRKARWLPQGWTLNWEAVNRPALMRVTRGNPLLVELAVREVKGGAKLIDLTEAKLLQVRAERIVAAVKVAGMGDPDQLFGLAVATLTGGLAKFGPDGKAVRFAVPGWEDAVAGKRFDGAAAVFSLEAAEAARIPPVRPERIGDAFVRAVVEELRSGGGPGVAAYPQIAAQIVDEAWRQAPRALLRAMPRLLRVRDAVSDSLRRGRPEVAGLDRIAVAEAYAEAAMLVPIEDWRARAFDDGAGALAAALEWFERLAPEEGREMMGRVVGLGRVTSLDAVVRGPAMLALFAAAAGRALEGVGLDGDAGARAGVATYREMLEGLNTWGADVEALHAGVLPGLQELTRRLAVAAKGGLVPWRGWVQAGSEGAYAFRGLVPALLKALAETVGAEVAPDFEHLALQMAVSRHFGDWAKPCRAVLLESLRMMPRPAVLETAAGVAWAARCIRLMAYTDPAGMEEAERLLPVTEERIVLLERAAAWRYAGFERADASDADGTAEAAGRVEAIIDPAFKGQRDFELERAVTWRSVAFARANAGYADGTAEAAGGVEAIVDPAFAGQRDFELERVMAWRSVAVVRENTADADGTVEAAGRVEAIVDPAFAGQRDFELERAVTWRSVAFARANAGYADGTVEAAGRVEAIVDPAFAGQRDFELERVMAWRSVAVVRENTADADGTVEAAGRVEAIVDPAFAGQRDFELERVMAWRIVAIVRGNTGDADGTAEAAGRVEAIVSSAFAGQRDFELERVGAWRSVAFVRSIAGDGKGTAETAGRVEAIIDPAFAGQRDFELEHVRAWRSVAIVRGNTGDADGTAEAAGRVEAIVSSAFAGQRDFELERVRAWRSVAFVRSIAGDGKGTAEAAGRVEAIVDPAFAGQRGFELERVGAWRSVAFVRSIAGDGKGTAETAGRVEAIIDPAFAGQRDFELEHVRAWRSVAIVRGNTGDADGTAEAAGRVEAIVSSAFAGQRDFELERVRAWRSVAFVRSIAGDGKGTAEAAGRVEAIIDPAFAGQRDFELERVMAWRIVAVVRGNTRDADGTAEAAGRVEAIVSSAFAGQRDFELERVMAWRSVANVRGNTGDADGTAEAAGRVEAIVSSAFAGQRDFELERVGAFGSVLAVQFRGDADGTVEAAGRVMAIIDPIFTGQRDFELVRAGAFGSLATALANAADTERAVAAAEKVEAIVDSAFVGQRNFELQRAHARHVLCFLSRGNMVEHGAAVAWLQAGIPVDFANETEFGAIVAKARHYAAWET